MNPYKYNFPLILLLVTLCYACPNNPNKIQKTESLKSLNGTWNLTSIEIEKRAEKNPYNMEKTVRLTFEDNEQEGKITGNDICGNQVFGDYQLNSDNKIEVLRFGGTKRGCGGWASNFWGLIRKVESYEVNEGQLKFYFDKGTNYLIFEKE